MDLLQNATAMLQSPQTLQRSLISVNHSVTTPAQNEPETWQLSNSFQESWLLLQIIQSPK